MASGVNVQKLNVARANKELSCSRRGAIYRAVEQLVRSHSLVHALKYDVTSSLLSVHGVSSLRCRSALCLVRIVHSSPSTNAALDRATKQVNSSE